MASRCETHLQIAVPSCLQGVEDGGDERPERHDKAKHTHQLYLRQISHSSAKRCPRHVHPAQIDSKGGSCFTRH